MTKCFFENLENIVKSNIASAEKKIKIAVAWINFDIYGNEIYDLIRKGVKVKILLHDDFSNHRYDAMIDQMNTMGAEIKFIDFRGIMHHKFCIIDKRLCMFGSFNWTKNANTRNIEDLNICDEIQLIYDYKTEFKSLWELSNSDIALLRNPMKCPFCGTPLVNILLFDREGHNQTEIRILSVCNCSQREVYRDYYDISVYNNYIGLVDCYRDQLQEAQTFYDEIAYQEILARMDFALSCYWANVRNNRMGFKIIHAVGIRSFEQQYSKDDFEPVYRIIWKEKYTSPYIDDTYDVLD